MISSSEPIVLKELFRTDIESAKIKKTAFQFFKRAVPFETLLNPVEKIALRELLFKIESLANTADHELASAFLKIKRAILESKKWLEINREAYQIARPDAPLPLPIQERYTEIQASFDLLLRRIDADYLPKILSLGNLRLPGDFFENAMQGYDKILPFFTQLVSRIPEDQTVEREAIALFLDRKKSYLKQVCEFAEAHCSEWEKICLNEGRGLYIFPPSLSPFPLMYSIQGRLYILMDVAGMIVGSGTAKLSTRCIELMQGEVYALIKPRSSSLPDEPDELKKQTIQWNFFDAWKESEFLLRLEGCRGILQLHDRLAFEKDAQNNLYLVEELYLDGSLFKHFIHAIDQNKLKTRFALKQKMSIARDLLSGIKSIHEKGIVHHDIKADNVLLSLSQGEEKAVITDFNLAFLQDDKLGKMVAESVAIWTAPELNYCRCHPEMTIDSILERKTPAVDVWSMGIILYILFNYEYPSWWDFSEAETNVYVSQLKRDWLPQQPETEFISPLLKKMLNPDPQERCSSSEALALFEQINLRTQSDDPS